MFGYAHIPHPHAHVFIVFKDNVKMASSSTSSSSSSSTQPISNAGVTPSDGTSDVWKYFKKKKEQKKALCTICNKLYAYCGGTTNLREHLEAFHSVVYKRRRSLEEESGSSQRSLDSFLRPKQCSDARAKDIVQKIVSMIIVDMRPIRIVECPGFRSLINFLEPGFVMPGRKTISSIIHLQHEQGKKKLIKMLDKDASSIALTTDIWTSTSVEAFMALSAHYITRDWKSVCCVLETKFFPGSHTGIAISDRILETVAKCRQ